MTDANLTALSAAQAAAEIARGALTAEAYCQAHLDRVAAVEPEIRAFIHFDREHVMAQVRALDERRQRGLALGPLYGIPVGVKDIIDTADYPTENGSPMYAGRRPRHDATVVSKLRAAGAVIFGKTVTTEVAFRHPGATRNPHDPERTPGGSSSGSAAAVAAGMLPLALGTQTAGSVIRPASYCGVVGVKPSHGLVSRTGVLLHSHTLDHVGVFARSVGDAALLLDVIAGYDPEDPDTRPMAAPNCAATAAETPPTPPILAFVRTPMWDQADAEARAAFEACAARLGDRCERVDLPDWFADVWVAQRTVMASDMAHRHGALVARMPDKASEPLRAMMQEGRALSAVAYLDAQALRRRATEWLSELLLHYYAILTPASTGIAPKGLEFTGDAVFNALWTLTGLPAVTLPLLSGADDMPIGVQLVGAPGDDARLLRTAAWLEAESRKA